jgi:hypothetical protein
VNPAPATTETRDESDVSPDGELQICFEHWRFKVCYTTGKP